MPDQAQAPNRSAGERKRRSLPPGAAPSRTFAGTTSEQQVAIVADIHEARSGIPEGLARLGATVRSSPLEAGDYFLGCGTLVERKRVVDLHTAVCHGRFWPQMLKLREACRYPYLLIEGTDIDRGPLHPASVRSICLGVIAQGIPVLRSYQQRDSAIWIYRLAVRVNRVGRRDRRDFTPRTQPTVKLEGPEAILAAVPGISTALARVLLDRFGSVSSVVAAGPDRWREVDGIGPERVKALERAFAEGVIAED